MRALPVLAAIALAAAVGAGHRAAAQIAPEPARLSLQATASATAAPDIAMVTLGVLSEGATAAEAMGRQQALMTSVFAAVRNAGVAERDIQTASFDLQPRYADYDPGRDARGPRIVGYTASNRISLRIRDVAAVGAVLDATTKAGVNQIDSIAFAIDDASALEDQARRDALADLRQRAGLYAEAGGFRLGRLLEVSEQAGWSSPQPIYARAEAASMAATPIAGGEVGVSITVSMVYEILP